VALSAGLAMIAGDAIAAAAQTPARCVGARRDVARAAVAATFVGGNVVLYEYFRRAWWSGERANHIWINYDWDAEFRDQDKAGHFLGGYHLARFGKGLLQSACVSKRKAVWWAAGYAFAFQTQIELWDGMQKKYGFSPPDLLFDGLGAAYAVAQIEQPRLTLFKPTISYAPTKALHSSPPGSELRPTVDYSGQTYWISTDVHALLPDEAKPYWPTFVRLSVGHSITDWVDPTTHQTERAKRKLVLSLDFDAERLPGDFPVWRTVKHQLSYYHFPAPALELTPRLKAVRWYR
jgi:uncharacterized protein YfiM (DUF2279 family)